jgi:hypothetical protein
MKKLMVLIGVIFLNSFCYAETIYQSYVIKDPYPSKIGEALNTASFKFFITLRIDEDATYWYTLNIIEPDVNTKAVWAVIQTVIGSDNSAAYDVGTDTTDDNYVNAIGGN